MPSSSTKQRNYILYLRGKYKTKKNTPEKQKWIWNDEWMTISESSFRSEIKAWIDPEGNYLPFIRIKNHDDMLPLGLRYGDALRKDWIRVYKTPDKLHITCCNFDAKKLKCCIKIFNQIDEFKNMEIVVADGSKIINYNPLFRERCETMKRYTRFFENTSLYLPAKYLSGMEDVDDLEKHLDRAIAKGYDEWDGEILPNTKEKWAQTVNVSEPVDVVIWRDGTITFNDGHHRVLAGRILDKDIPVNIQSNKLNSDVFKIWLDRIKRGFSPTQINPERSNLNGDYYTIPSVEVMEKAKKLKLYHSALTKFYGEHGAFAE